MPKPGLCGVSPPWGSWGKPGHAPTSGARVFARDRGRHAYTKGVGCQEPAYPDFGSAIPLPLVPERNHKSSPTVPAARMQASTC